MIRCPRCFQRTPQPVVHICAPLGPPVKIPRPRAPKVDRLPTSFSIGSDTKRNRTPRAPGASLGGRPPGPCHDEQTAVRATGMHRAGYTWAEIGRQLGYDPKTVKKAVTRSGSA